MKPFVFALILLSTPTLAAEASPAGAPFCRQLSDLRDFVAALAARDMSTVDRMEAAQGDRVCAVLNPGVRLDVTRTYADFGGTAHPVGVRVYGNGTWVEGFTVREMVGR